MAHVLVHAGLVDDLTADREALPGDVQEALEKHMVYARFGALLPDLPLFGGLVSRTLTRVAGLPPTRPAFATLFHNGAPVALGLRICELVARVSFVGSGPGVAVIAGYFSHIAADRTLAAPAQDLVRRARLMREHPAVTLQRVESIQALLHLRRQFGRDVAGWRGVTEKLRILKRKGYPFRGVGGGLHLLVQRACMDTLGPAPRKRDLDRWVQGLHLYARFLGSPAGLAVGLPEDSLGLRKMLYQGTDVDFESLYRGALARARHHISLAFDYMSEGDFSRDSREHFFSALPEGSML